VPNISDGPEQVVASGTVQNVPRRNLSVGSLVLSNLVTIGIAIVQKWPVGTVMWIYWCQSITIGIFMALRMAALHRFSTEGFSSSGRRVPETRKGKMETVTFFVIHYGFFHLGYLVFLLALAFPDIDELVWMLACAGTFAMNHFYSFRRNVQEDLEGRPNIGMMMFMPYARVLPMHLCMGLAAGTTNNVLALTVFMLLKTGADVLMHVVEHHIYRKSRG
jgi:hypothetical protein